MRINCHSHIFNFQSVFTSQTLETLINRIVELELPNFIEDAFTSEVAKIIEQSGVYADEEQLLRNIIKKVKKSGQYKNLVDQLSSSEKLKLEIINIDQLDNLAVKGLLGVFKWLGNQVLKDSHDARKTTIIDAVDFVRVALQPKIRKVTDNLMEQLKSDDAIIALMMDITKDGSERELFENQIEETSKMVLAYPGRIFPFVAVNPRRSDHFEIMEHALQSRGFVGVKLYPSLGYDIDSAEMDRVYDYCAERKIPLMMHCSNGGFYYRKEFRKNSAPDLWPPILDRYPNLRICFGHFGGGENLAEGTIPNDSWTAKILRLMKDYTGVYADISYHTEPMDGGLYEENYFRHCKKLMKDAVYRNRLLFGTDYFLVRRRLKEKSHWKYFEERFSKAVFRKIAEQNPIDYLGLRKGSRKPYQNIENHVRFIYSHRDRIERKPVPWLSAEVKEILGSSAKLPLPDLGSRWAWNNDAHYRVWSFMKRQMRPHHRKLKFKSTGRLRLRHMQYWNKEFESQDIWKQKLSAMSENMDSEFRANNATYEADYNMYKALVRLGKAFDEGDLKLYKLAAICDQIYQFEQERMGN